MSERTEPNGTTRLLIDLGPIIVFFAANLLAPVSADDRIYVATGSFMAAMIAAMILSLVKFRNISPLLWFSGAMVLIMGGLTIWLHNPTFIKLKPTLYYVLVSSLLFFGLATGRPLLRAALGSAYPGVDETGWRKLTRNWALFFLCLAALNELVWRNSSTNFWLSFKLWGVMPLTLLFAAANVPMLLRHGLKREEAKPVEPGPVE